MSLYLAAYNRESLALPPTFQMAGKKYVCLCSKCSTLSFTDEAGQIQPGCRVAKTTRREHEEQDTLNALMEEAGLNVEEEMQAAEQGGGGGHTELEVSVFQQALAPVTTLCITLAAWLNLHVGISRENSAIFLKALHILATTLDLIFLVLHQAGFKMAVPTVQFPLDIRTVYHSGLEPNITRTPCCPTCFKPYTLEDLPDTCDWKKSPRTVWPCGTALKKRIRTQDKKTKKKMKTKLVPCCLYATQSFESWLQFFLSRPQIEDYLEQSFQQEQARLNTPVPDIMRDVHDSPAWRTLQNYLLTHYHLVFAFYIDWFNPFTLKIAGQVVSFGAIVLYCLNLPIEARFLLENIFVLSVIPGDPDYWTIVHILSSFARTINEFAPPGKVVQTHRNPLGVLTAARILPLIADLQAMRKVAGYMAYNATYFCTWCLLKIKDIENLDSSSWTLRNSATVLAQARAWHDAVSASQKNTLSSVSGVCWTPIHDIFGFDPVNHILLGFLHNWLEGVLAQHLRILWGYRYRPSKSN
ncbi:Peptidase-M24 domain-containing protein [Mycena sanguinolenta]|uniref:Peptidase-M24 domain-containing protein n=1 Tax=Mycena sanguinolenta TaxID=230812 RepID=A0A8H7DCI4_9AGAR|nr:Peptidase-M24 domain-containing protein [Mycena sanguinolenta]